MSLDGLFPPDQCDDGWAQWWLDKRMRRDQAEDAWEAEHDMRERPYWDRMRAITFPDLYDERGQLKDPPG